MMILLTREQIGIALEYSDPDVALSKIHKKHKELDELSVVTKLESTDGKEYNTTLYSERGIMEIFVGQDNQKPTYSWIGYGIL